MSDWKQGLHDLLGQVARKDEQAFTRLYEGLHHTAIGMILAEVGGLDEYEAESIYSQAMYKIWCKAGTYQGRLERQDLDATAWAWIRVTILHTAQDVSRVLRRRNMAEILESEMVSDEEIEEGQDPSPIDELSMTDVSPQERPADSPALRAETREGLAEFMAALDERERKIICLLSEGRPHGEVAALVGISPSRLSQIVSTLREKAGLMVQSH